MRSRVIGSRAVSGVRRGRAERGEAGAALAAAAPGRSGAVAGGDGRVRAAAPPPFGAPRAAGDAAPFPLRPAASPARRAGAGCAAAPLPLAGARFSASRNSRSSCSRLARSMSSSEPARPGSCGLSILPTPGFEPPSVADPAGRARPRPAGRPPASGAAANRRAVRAGAGGQGRSFIGATAMVTFAITTPTAVFRRRACISARSVAISAPTRSFVATPSFMARCRAVERRSRAPAIRAGASSARS